MAALTKEGYERHVHDARLKKERGQRLSKDDLRIERLAAMAKLSADDMRGVMTGTEEEYRAIVAALDLNQQFVAAMSRAAWHTLPR